MGFSDVSIATEQKVEQLIERVKRLEDYVTELAADLRKAQEHITELRNGRKK